MNDQECESFLEANKVKITVGNATSILRKVYEKVKGVDPKIFFDFLGRVLVERPELHADNLIRLMNYLEKSESADLILLHFSLPEM